jgi:hypothetical protein
VELIEFTTGQFFENLFSGSSQILKEIGMRDVSSKMRGMPPMSKIQGAFGKVMKNQKTRDSIKGVLTGLESAKSPKEALTKLVERISENDTLTDIAKDLGEDET